MNDERRQILLVEDNEDDVVLLRHALAQIDPIDLEITHVARCSEALSHVRNKPTEVVLLDIALPDGSGLDIVASLKASPSHPTVVAMTGQSSEAMAVNALRSGVDNYISKPIRATELRIVIQDALDQHEDLTQ